MKKTAVWTVCALLCGALQAGTYYWTGAENAYWTNAANWQVSDGADGYVAAPNPPGRWYAAADGYTATNGVKREIAVFGDMLAGARAMTIDFDGVYSIQQIIVTGKDQRYTFGSSTTQSIPIETFGVFCAGATPDTKVAVQQGYLRTGIECETNGYGTDYVVIRNNSSETFEMGAWGGYTYLSVLNSAGDKYINAGQEMGLWFEGTGHIHYTKNYSKPAGGGNNMPPLSVKYRMTTGRLTLSAKITARAFAFVLPEGETDKTTVREVEIAKNGILNCSTGQYGVLDVKDYPVRIFGEGLLQNAASWKSADPPWKCTPQNFANRTDIDCPMSIAWGTEPTAANGGDAFARSGRYGLWMTGGVGPLNLNCEGGSTMSGVVSVVSASAAALVNVRKFGCRGNYEGSAGDCDFLLGNGPTIRYVGAGETTDHAFMITNRAPQGTATSKVYPATFTLEQAGTGALTVASDVTLPPGVAGTLTLKNDTDQDATYAKALSGDLSVKKTGSGTWRYAAAHTYAGTTAVEAGTLFICKGASVAGAVTLAENAALVFEGDATGPVQATCPALTATGPGARLQVGANCTLTLSSVASSGGGMLDVQLADATATVKLTDVPGEAPSWLTLNGDPVEFDEEGRILKRTIKIDVAIPLHGGRIPDEPEKSVGVTTSGDPSDGPIKLASGSASAVATLAQKVKAEPALVALESGDTLTAGQLFVAEDADSLIVSNGTFKAASGTFTFWNDSTNGEIVVKSAPDFGAAAKIVKMGAGRASVEPRVTYAKEVEITAGELALDVSGTQEFALSGSGTFAKEGDGALTVSQANADFSGDYVVRGGVVSPGSKTASALFGAENGGALVITNGATLDLGAALSDANAGNLTFGNKTIRISGDGRDGLGAIQQPKDIGSSPFNRLVLDGDASIGLNAYGTKTTNLSKQNGQNALLDMGGHTLTKKGYGRFGISDVVVTNMGPVVLEAVPEPAAGDDYWNFLVVGNAATQYFLPEGGTMPTLTMGNRTRLIEQNLTNGIPWNISVEPGARVQLGTFTSVLNSSSARPSDELYNVFKGDIEIGEGAVLQAYCYGDSTRSIRLLGRISGAGSLESPAGAGRYFIMAPTNTWTGTTKFPLSAGSGSFGSVTFARSTSLPDYSKFTASFSCIVCLRLNEDDTAWPFAEIGRLLKEGACGGNDTYVPHVAPDLTDVGDRTIDWSAFGNCQEGPSADTQALGFGVAGGATLTLTGDADAPNRPFCALDGTLRLSGGTKTIRLLQVSGCNAYTTGRVEVVEGAALKAVGTSKSLLASHDKSFATLDISNGSFGPGVPEQYPLLDAGVATGAMGVLRIGPNGAADLGALQLATGERSYGGALFVDGGRLTCWKGSSYFGNKGQGYVEMTSGRMEFKPESALRTAQSPYASMIFRMTGGTVDFDSDTHLYLSMNGGLSHFYMTGGTVDVKHVNVQLCQTSSNNTNAVAVLTLDGADARFQVSSAGKGLDVGQQSNCVAIVNLNGGTLAADRLYFNRSTYASSQASLNFNGGTFEAVATRSSGAISADIRTTIGPNGGAIDTAGRDLTVETCLGRPTGQGLVSVPWTAEGGYEMPPRVEILGDGTGASAIAEYNRATKTVTGIRITSAGNDYTWAKACISRGSRFCSTNYYKIVEIDCALATNMTSGAFTKKGEGTLTLTGANTYGGATIVRGGVLRLGAAAALPDGSAVRLQGGAVEVAPGVDFPDLTLDVSAFDFSDVRRKYVLANVADGADDPAITLNGTLPHLWEVVRRGNRMVLKCRRGTMLFVR